MDWGNLNQQAQVYQSQYQQQEIERVNIGSGGYSIRQSNQVNAIDIWIPMLKYYDDCDYMLKHYDVCDYMLKHYCDYGDYVWGIY